MSFGKVVLNYGDYIIRESELRLLSNSEWLNDALIGFYFEYLGKQLSPEKSKLVKFIGPEVAQLVKMISADEVPLVLGDLTQDLIQAQYIFLPVNDSLNPEVHSGGSHWSLLVFSRVDNAFVHFDSSFANNNQEDANILFKKLSPIASDSKVSFRSFMNCKKQTNGFDCGIHVICNAQCISDYVQNHPEASIVIANCPTVTSAEASTMRSKLVELIDGLAKI